MTIDQANLTPLSRPLTGTLLLKSVCDEADVERLDAFNAAIHGSEVQGFTRNLLLHHPHAHPDDWLYVEDTASGHIVSSLCLIPWTWRYDGIDLKAGEMGVVGTLPDVRRQGLVRALVGCFKERLQAGGYHLSHIQGIPYYYRQFGYEYALPLEGGWRLELHQMPLADADGFRFRPASVDDIPMLQAYYDEASRTLDIHAVRDADIWRYLLEHGIHTDTARAFTLVLGDDGQPVGYYGIALNGFGTGLIVSEASRLGHAAASACLPRLRRLAEERKKDYVRFMLPAGDDLLGAVEAAGGRDWGTYAWQIHLPDLPHLLRAIGPALERRLADSPFAGLSEAVALNTYRQTFTLHFEGGRLQSVTAAPEDAEQAAVHLPPNLLPVLVLGDKSAGELVSQYQDVYCRAGKPLIDTLFPRRRAYIHTIY